MSVLKVMLGIGAAIVAVSATILGVKSINSDGANTQVNDESNEGTSKDSPSKIERITKCIDNLQVVISKLSVLFSGICRVIMDFIKAIDPKCSQEVVSGNS